MTDTALDERRSALDDFAREGEQARRGDVMTMSAFAPPSDRVFGAQQVAVQRDESRVLAKLKALAAAAGDDWYYRFPVKNKKTGRTDWIEGPSIKLTNDLARLYGNCDVDTRVQDLGDSWLYYARFMDLETGFSLTRPFQQRKSAGRIGGDDDARRLDIAFQIGASKAIRNVVSNALQTFSDYAFEEAKNALVDKIGKNLEGWRKKTAERVAELIEVKRVELVLGRTVAEWLAPDIARIIAMMKAVSDGMATMDETFPPLDKAGAAGEQQQDVARGEKKPTLDEFAQGKPAEEKTPAKPDAAAQAKPAEQKPEQKTEQAPIPDPTAGSASAEQQQSPSKAAAADAEPPSDRGSSDGGAPTEADARRAGADARDKKMSRKAVPAQFRQEPLLTAFLDGFDTGEAEDREPGADG